MIDIPETKISPIVVKLLPYELNLAKYIGTTRHEEAIRQGKDPNNHGVIIEPLQKHIIGACGELAFAKALNFYYSGSVNTFKVGGDVGEIQVRTRSQHWYELIIRKDDCSEDLFVLVTTEDEIYKIHGYIRAGRGKQRRFLQTYGNRPEAHFVLQEELWDIMNLYEHVVAKHRDAIT